MLTWPPGTKVFVCTRVTDMRCGFDSLAEQVRLEQGWRGDGFVSELFVLGQTADEREDLRDVGAGGRAQGDGGGIHGARMPRMERGAGGPAPCGRLSLRVSS